MVFTANSTTNQTTSSKKDRPRGEMHAWVCFFIPNIVKNETVVKEPTAEVLGNFTEMSRGKFGGSDLSPTKRKQ